MSSPRLLSWLPIASVGVLAAGVLGWLLLAYSGGKDGMVSLPDPGRSTVDSLIDPDGRLTLADVEALDRQQWKPWSGSGFLTAKRGEILWIRVTLRNSEDRTLRGILDIDDYFADRVDAWIGSGAERTHQLVGETVSKPQKALVGREIALPVTVPALGEQVILLRIEDFFSGYARPVWWPAAEAFHQATMRGSLAEGIYLGGLFALLLYNALLALRLRQRDMAFYVLYLGSAATFIILTRALIPALGWAFGSPGLETALTLTMALSGFFLTQFAAAFLELETHFPRINRWARVWCGILLLLAAGSLTTPWWPEAWPPRWLWLATICIGATHVGLLTLSLAAWRAGAQQARFFVLSFGCLFAGSLPMVAVWLLQIGLRDVAMRGLMVGSALEMLLLSLAVADRFAKAQRKLVKETEHRRMLEEAYADELAEEVRERTRELRSANVDKDRMLAVLGHDLRAPLTGLMRAAEETPGEFSRDVTRTSRALLLMIEDLVLWTRLREGSRGGAVHQASALVLPAVALHHSLAEHGGVELVLEIPEQMCVDTDLVLAQTLVRNLLANALKFARTRVTLRAEADPGGNIRMTVGNDGPTLSDAVAARLAAGEDEPMTATGGLGLRLCREICQALAIQLETRTAADGGTEFGFVLRRAPEVVKAAELIA